MKQEEKQKTDCDDFPSPIEEFPFWERMYAVSMTKPDFYSDEHPFHDLTHDIKVDANNIINTHYPITH